MRKIVKLNPLPEFLKQALQEHDSDGYLPGLYKTPDDLQIACKEGKTFVLPIIFPTWSKKLPYYGACGLGVFIILDMFITFFFLASTPGFNMPGYFMAIAVLLVVEALYVIGIGIQRSEKYRTKKRSLIICPEGLAMVNHWLGMDWDKCKGEYLEWKDIDEIQEYVFLPRGEMSQRIEITDRWKQRDEILTHFQLPESGTSRFSTAFWWVILKSREGRIIIELTFVDPSEFPIPYPVFLLSELVATYWNDHRSELHY